MPANSTTKSSHMNSVDSDDTGFHGITKTFSR